MYTHIHTLCLFSVAHMYMCLGLTPWDWLTYQVAHPWGTLILLPLAAVDCPQPFLQEGGLVIFCLPH